MRAVVYDAPSRFDVREVPNLEPGPDEIVLRTRVTGVCGTDLHLHSGRFMASYPLTPGHEIVGEVAAVGSDVTAFARGQLVAVDNMTSCGVCAACHRARPQFCLNLQALGVTRPGGFADEVLTPADKCHPVDDLGADVAVMAEPTACALHGMDVLDLSPGADVLVFGAGPTGLVLAELLVHGGAGRVTVAAPSAFKLDLAQAAGVDETVLIRRGATEETVTGLHGVAPDGFDVVVDATGAVEILGISTRLLRHGGTLFVYGMADEAATVALEPYDVFRRELTIKGSFSQAFAFERALRLIRSGRVMTDGIVTHTFALDRYGDALAAAQADPTCLKATVVP